MMVNNIFEKVRGRWDAARRDMRVLTRSSFGDLEKRTRESLGEVERLTRESFDGFEKRAKENLESFEKRAKESLETLEKHAAGRVDEVPEQLRGAWDGVLVKLRGGLDVPMREELDALRARVEELAKTVDKLTREKVARAQADAQPKAPRKPRRLD